jgi:hypothetical protein
VYLKEKRKSRADWHNSFNLENLSVNKSVIYVLYIQKKVLGSSTGSAMVKGENDVN